MDDTGLPQISDELPELTALPTQDIPEAVRETSETPSQLSSKRRPLLWGAGGLGVAALVAVSLILAFRSQAPAFLSSTTTRPEDGATASTGTDPAASATDPADQKPVVLGHRAYEEAPAAELEAVPPDGQISLRRSAAKKFREMADAAAADGVLLVPLSGFRSVEEQTSLFFEVKAKRGENTTKRAEVSAPPGYSEHHTGYAVDIGDGDHPGTDLQFDFEETDAFKWLEENAAYYSFELSFPKNNSLGVSYEPWHWRFVGDRQSLETFYQNQPDSEAGDQSTGAKPQQATQATEDLKTEDAKTEDARIEDRETDAETDAETDKVQ